MLAKEKQRKEKGQVVLAFPVLAALCKLSFERLFTYRKLATPSKYTVTLPFYNPPYPSLHHWLLQTQSQILTICVSFTPSSLKKFFSTLYNNDNAKISYCSHIVRSHEGLKNYAFTFDSIYMQGVLLLFYTFAYLLRSNHRVHIFTRDETGLMCLPTQLERTLQFYL